MAATSAPMGKRDLSISSKSAGYYNYPMKDMPPKEEDAGTDNYIYQELPATYDNGYDVIPAHQLSTSTVEQSDSSTVLHQKPRSDEKKSTSNKMRVCMLVSTVIAALATVACFAVVFIEITALKSKPEAGSQLIEDVSNVSSTLNFDLQQLNDTLEAIIRDEIRKFQAANSPEQTPEQDDLITNQNLSQVTQQVLQLNSTVHQMFQRIATLDENFAERSLQLNNSIYSLDERVTEKILRINDSLHDRVPELNISSLDGRFSEQILQLNLSTRQNFERIRQLDGSTYELAGNNTQQLNLISSLNERVTGLSREINNSAYGLAEDNIQMLNRHILNFTGQIRWLNDTVHENSQRATSLDDRVTEQIRQLHDSAFANTEMLNQHISNFTGQIWQLHNTAQDNSQRVSSLNERVIGEIRQLNDTARELSESNTQHVFSLDQRVSQAVREIQQVNDSAFGLAEDNTEMLNQHVSNLTGQIRQLNDTAREVSETNTQHVFSLDQRVSQAVREIQQVNDSAFELAEDNIQMLNQHVSNLTGQIRQLNDTAREVSETNTQHVFSLDQRVSQAVREIQQVNDSAFGLAEDNIQMLNQHVSNLTGQIRQLNESAHENSQRFLSLNERVTFEIQQLNDSAHELVESNAQEFNQHVSNLDERLTEQFSHLNTSTGNLDLLLEQNTLDIQRLRRNASSISERISEDVLQLNTATENLQTLQEQVNHISNQFSAVSCHALPPSSPSGYYLVRNSSVPVYCHMSLSCGGVTGGWMRVAELNMTDTSQQCPSELSEYNSLNNNSLNIRTCVRNSSNSGCSSINDLLYLSKTNIQYSSVCGRARGYQIGTTNAFRGYHYWSHGIDSAYVDGVSITRGNHPKHHVWTFAAALDKSGSQLQNNNRQSYCPCQTATQNDPPTHNTPPFVGSDYFCDAGNEVYTTGEYGFQSEPLWDGSGCACCTNRSPSLPWFHKQLPQPTTDNIQVRVCKDESTNEDIAIESMEVYVR